MIMSAKNCDAMGRFRSVTVGFRVSPEEGEQLDRLVKLSGLTKQDYITDRLLEKTVVVQGNPKVYKALKGQLTDVLNGNAKYDCNGWFEISVPPMSSMVLVENDGSFEIDCSYSEPKEVYETSEVEETIEKEPELVPEEIVKGKYRHFKGNEYEVIDFAKDSETCETMVIYRALYGDGELWVRPYKMFQEIIERDGKRIRRFERIE